MKRVAVKKVTPVVDRPVPRCDRCVKAQNVCHVLLTNHNQERTKVHTAVEKNEWFKKIKFVIIIFVF